MHNGLLIMFLVVTGALSCSNQPKTDYEKVEKFLTDHSFKTPLKNFNEIIVINGIGTCINCNNTFARFISKKLSNPKILFIISQNGTKVDISYFLKQKKNNGYLNNLLFDYKEDFDNLNLINGTGILKLEDEKITNKTVINSQNISEYEN